jgi:molybdate transport system substrate-binding protein
MRRLLALAAGLVVLAGCGDDSTVSGGGDKPQLVVSAASSMKEALTACAPGFADASVKLQFAGSDELAAQIRQGVPVDVFASANTKLPDALAQEGKLDRPVTFATNQLVLAVPADGAKVDGLDALAQPGVTLVIGAEGVPVGDYTRTVLAKLGQ